MYFIRLSNSAVRRSASTLASSSFSIGFCKYKNAAAIKQSNPKVCGLVENPSTNLNATEPSITVSNSHMYQGIVGSPSNRKICRGRTDNRAPLSVMAAKAATHDDSPRTRRCVVRSTVAACVVLLKDRSVLLRPRSMVAKTSLRLVVVGGRLRGHDEMGGIVGCVIG